MARTASTGPGASSAARTAGKAPTNAAITPYPGIHPTVVTSDRDWGGWRVPGSEYDLDPFRV
jgi:hypothetical protein